MTETNQDPTIEAAEAEAERVALEWLALVDADRHEDAWDAASELMRGAIGKDALAASLRGARGPLGACEERAVTKATYATELPGAPDGEYVVIELATRFANKAHGVETITPRRDADGVWRVSGYFIR